MGRSLVPTLLVRMLICAGVVLGLSASAGAQEAAEGGGNVGYIDSAIPRNTVRFRFDDTFDNTHPTCAEFLYAKSGIPGSPGPPLPEARIDYQEYNGYVEWAFFPNFSAFLEEGIRAIHPRFNENNAGLDDLNAGFKWAFMKTDDATVTFQLRTYVPSGNPKRGLGTGHVSLEPAVLFNWWLNDFLLLEGEMRYWTPIGGTDFSGDVVRYGLGLSYTQRERPTFHVSPVLEIVGWTVLGGKQLDVLSPTVFTVENAAGMTIVNLKAGLRFGYENIADLYIGYGLALTDPAWYRDVFRVELRWFF